MFVLPAPALPSPDPGTQGPSQEAAYELAFWDAIKDSTQAEVYEAYLAQYPDGPFAALARIKIKSLTPKDTQTAALPPPPAIEEIDDTYYALKRSKPSRRSGNQFREGGPLAGGRRGRGDRQGLGVKGTPYLIDREVQFE